MSDFLIAPAACSELDEIWYYYAVELQNPDAADRIRDEIFDAFAKLAQTPGMGHFFSLIPTGWNHSAQRLRVARNELPWVPDQRVPPNLKGLNQSQTFFRDPTGGKPREQRNFSSFPSVLSAFSCSKSLATRPVPCF